VCSIASSKVIQMLGFVASPAQFSVRLWVFLGWSLKYMWTLWRFWFVKLNYVGGVGWFVPLMWAKQKFFLLPVIWRNVCINEMILLLTLKIFSPLQKDVVCACSSFTISVAPLGVSLNCKIYVCPSFSIPHVLKRLQTSFRNKIFKG